MESEILDHPCDDGNDTEMELEDYSSGMVDPAPEMTTFSSSRPTKLSVLEKIVFCVDQRMCSKQYQRYLLHAITLFIDTKKIISNKPVEFEFVIFKSNENEVSHSSNIDILSKFTEYQKPDNDYVDLSALFNNLGKFKLPDPSIYGSTEDPPFIYHFIILYNDRIPVLKTPNSYYFLINNPFVTLDILHINKPKVINSESISAILKCLIPSQKDYFQTSNWNNLPRNIIKLIGNPLLR